MHMPSAAEQCSFCGFVPLVRYRLCWRVLIMLLCAVTGTDLPSYGGLEVQCVSATGGGQQDPEEHV